MPAARQGFLGLSALILALVVLQFFLAGLGVFGAASFDAHKAVGYALQFLTLGLLLIAALGRLGRSGLIFGGGLLVLTVIQGVLGGLGDDAPGVAAFHPLVALIIFVGAAQAFLWARGGFRGGAPGRAAGRAQRDR